LVVNSPSSKHSEFMYITVANLLLDGDWSSMLPGAWPKID
jgi:hypothetical protein